MATRNLLLKILADTKQARTQLNALKGTPGDATTGAGGGGIAGLNTALFAMSGAALAAGSLLKSEFDQFTEYVTEVDHLSAALSVTVEEASFLYAAMEQFGISESVMIKMFQSIASEGIEPSVEALGDVIRQFDAIEDEAERATAAAEYFGQAGIGSILPWIDSLTASELEFFGIQQDSLLVTQEMVAELQQLEDASSLVNAEWDNIKGMLGTEVLPIITTIKQYMFLMMHYAKKIKEYLSGTNFPKGAGQYPGIPGGGGGFAAGGSFTVGGSGGVDSSPVGFMATPGETVTVGGGTSDMEAIMGEIRRMVDSIPTAITDAMERH